MGNFLNRILWKYFQKDKISSELKKPRKSRFLTFSEINSWILIGDYSGREDLDFVVADLKESGKRVQIYYLVSFKEMKNNPSSKSQKSLNYQLVPSNQFSFCGVPDLQLKNQIHQSETDVIINFAKKDVRAQLLMLASAASFRIGIESLGDYSLYDFSVLQRDDQSLTEVYFEIKKYLSCIRRSPINS